MKLTTPYSEIVNTNYIGKSENPIAMNEILKKAGEEKLTLKKHMNKRVLVIGIDEQMDFMDGQALGVDGAIDDVERFTKFIYNNMDEISNIAVSIDTHKPFQIFHACWWVDANGNHPDPYTAITLADINSGVWRPLINPKESIDYVTNLEQLGKQTLVIWPYHCIQGTNGCALEPQFSNIINFFSVAKKSVIKTIVKGDNPYSEMYGIIRPEYDGDVHYFNKEFLNTFELFDMIIVGGEAKSHCVLETLNQIFEFYETRPEITSKIYILEDCMSSIPGFEAKTEARFNEFKTLYKANIVKSTDDFIH